MIRIAFFLILISGTAMAQEKADVLIINGRIIDGTGNSWYNGDLAIKNGKLWQIGKNLPVEANRIIDAKGMVVSPGFIDVHGHIETGILNRPTADNYIYDGVTTIVTGNCGSSAPMIGAFLTRMDSLKASVNIATLIGHNDVREQVLKTENRAPDKSEQDRMDSLVAKAMQEGAVGLSTGLIYIPGAFAATDEVVSLAKAAAKYNGVYASHIRNEENSVEAAINEAIDIGRQADIPVQISHFKIGGKGNWGKSVITVGMIDKARKEGLEVTIDQYPYTASSTNLGVRVPEWVFAGGDDSMKSRLKDPQTRKQIKKEMLRQLAAYKFKNYSYAVVASYRADTSFNGKSITEINKRMGRKPRASNEAETILDMLEKGGAQMIYHSMNEVDVRNIMKYPYSMFGADAGVPIPGRGMPHPRAYGTNARVLGRYVREQNIITLEEAIRRMTSLAAQKFNLKNRGLLKEGFAADIIVFDPETITDMASFEQPHAYSKGIHYVLVNGAITVDAEVHTGNRNGQPIYGPGKR